MATRLYMVANSTPPVTPDKDAWTQTTGAVLRMLDTVKDASVETLGPLAMPANGGESGLVAQFVSPPLEAQTISGTVTVEFRAREHSTQDNVNKRWRSVRVINSAGVTVATLDTLVATTSTTELSATTIQGQVHANGSGFTSYTCAAGDRLLVAIGYGTSAGGTTPEVTCEWGGTGTDHAVANSDTTGTVPWVEFSQNLVFQATTTSVSSDLDMRWRVANRVTSDLDTRWRVAQAVSADLDTRWRVVNRVSSDLDVRWRVRDAFPFVRAATSSGTGAGTATTHTVQIPACEVGDDLWVSFTLNTGFGSVTAEPVGWTRIRPTGTIDDIGGTFRLVVYRKTATAAEVAGGTVALTVATAVRGNAGAASIGGADTTYAPDGETTASGNGASGSVSLTTSTANDLILTILAVDSGSELVTPTAPLVEIWDPVAAGITGQVNAAATATQAAAGAGTYGWTWTTSLAWTAWATGIRPAGSAPGTTPVSSDLDLRYRVANRVQTDLDARWRVLGTVTKDADLRWRVLGLASNAVDLRWRVAGVVSSDLDTRWRVLAAVTKDLDARWRVLGLAATDLDLRWRVNGVVATSVSNDLDLRYRVLGLVVKDADLRWRVAQAVSNGLDVRWRVRSVVANDAELMWRVRNLVSADADLRWRVLAEVARDLDLRWLVLGTVVVDLQLLWTTNGSPDPLPADVFVDLTAPVIGVGLDPTVVVVLLDPLRAKGSDLEVDRISVDLDRL